MPKGKHVLAVPKGKHVFGTVKVGEKGQIVIPKEARQKFNINSGDTLLVLGDDASGIIVCRPDVINEAASKVFSQMDGSG
ncbi:MAG: AbrB/MazE/SpoVT family DNA-binding domain-containing protein [Acutalibacteraceae bacterium]